MTDTAALTVDDVMCRLAANRATVIVTWHNRTKPTVIDTIDQPALIRHGGYGATQRRTWRSCTTCGWWVETSVSEVSP